MDEAVCAILIRRRKTLLGLRSPHKIVCPNCWDTVGGKVEKGESAEEALPREVLEEIGVLVVAAEEYRILAERRKRWGGPVIYRIFVVHRWRGRIRRLGDEHVELRWFTRRQALALDNLGHPVYREIFSQLPGLD